MSVESVLRPTGDVINTPILDQRLDIYQLFALSFGNAKVDRLFKDKIVNEDGGRWFMDLSRINEYERVLMTVFNSIHNNMNTSESYQKQITGFMMNHPTNDQNPDKMMELATNPMISEREFHQRTITAVFGPDFMSI